MCVPPLEGRPNRSGSEGFRMSVSPDQSYLVETRIIDGKKYILFPVGEDIEVNGQTVKFEADLPTDYQ